jgi:hypothetical protein
MMMTPPNAVLELCSDDRMNNPPAPEAGPASESPAPHSAYLKFIDNARKAVAIAMAVFGASCVVCSNLDPNQGIDRASWTASLGFCSLIGTLACLTAALVLTVEHLARPATPATFTLPSLLGRFVLILIAVVAIGVSMSIAYGAWQAIGAVVGVLLLLAALRERRMARVLRAFLAAIVLGLTLLGTQSPYQYARRHSDEIVAAGDRLMDQCPESDFHAYNPHPKLDKSADRTLFGQEIPPSDPRVPNVLRKLGARRIWVDKDRVAVYVGSNQYDLSQFPHPEIEFQIYRRSHPDTTSNPVWGFKGKGATKITERLWTNDY